MNETVNEVIMYVGVYVVTEKLNGKSKKLTNDRVNKKPRWKAKIEKEINEMREEVSILDELIRRVKVKSRIPPNIRLDEDAFSRRIYSPHSYVLIRSLLQDVFKTSWSRPIHLSWSYDFKTSSRHFQDVFKTSCKIVFETSARRLAKISSKRFQDVSSS